MDDLSIIYRVYINSLRMLLDRGYEINIEDIKISQEDFIKKYGYEKEIKIDLDKLEIVKNKKSNEKICMKWFSSDDINNEKLDTQYATQFIKKLEKEKINKGILILPHKNYITPAAKKVIQEPPIKDKIKIYIDLFYYNELIINITDHHLVPKHILLSNEERENLFKTYKLSENQLPKIQTSDPMAKYLGLNKKDVIRIEKQTDRGTRYVSYRLVI